VSDSLLALHDPHNGCLGLELTISVYTFVRFLILFFRLFELHLINLDAILLMRKGGIE